MNELLSDDSPHEAWQRIQPVLDDALHELKEADREALVLRFLEDRPLREVGTRLGLKENAARMRVDRALDKLRGLLAKRGITSTAAALAVVLAEQAGVAAPAGLAAGMDPAGEIRAEGSLPTEDIVTIVPADCACVLEQHLRDQGYELRLGAGIERVETADGRLLARFGGGRAAGTAGGSGGPTRATVTAALVTDLIVVCTGSRPTLDFLAPGQVTTDMGLLVDEHMETSVPGLYAAGDVAQALNPLTGRHEVVALWANARRQGRVAGLNMAGVHAEYAGNLPYNITKVGGLLFASAGTVREPDVVDLDETGGVAACAYSDGRLAGFNIVGAAIEAGPLVHALARGCDVRVSEAGSASDWARRVTWTSLNAG